MITWDELDPARVVCVGDVHGNTQWTCSVVYAMRALAPEQHPLVFVQAGDFGIWPGWAGTDYLAMLDVALEETGSILLFTEGNHDWHPELIRRNNGSQTGDRPVEITPRIWWLPRGMRWTWRGKSWLALGGAASVDRSWRGEGKDWWPQEVITAAQAELVKSGGHADVLLTHDCPSGVVHSFSSTWPPQDIVYSDAHRELLQGVVDVVQPELLLHGHLHRAYERQLGKMHVIGLHMDTFDGNVGVLDTANLAWAWVNEMGEQ